MSGIKELAKEYYANEVVNGDTCDDESGWTDCFVSGANALMSLPLADRMTEEEKERIRRDYAAARDGYWDENNDINIAVESVLESIFGSDFFNEERK